MARKKARANWKELEGEALATYLLERTTIPDRAWTDKKRRKGESRGAFIERLLGERAAA